MALDFLKVSSRPSRGVLEVYPKFIVRNGGDLMIRGKDFYAVYDESTGLWSTNEDVLISLIDKELEAFAKELQPKADMPIRIAYLWDSETNMIDVWHKYCQKQRRDCYHTLDEKLIFADETPKKIDYASKKLSYSLQKGEMPCYEKLISTLYAPDERHKLEWTIGAVVSGDSKDIQKFTVLYGGPGTGKSTALDIIKQLFDEYTSYFDAKALGNSNNTFALEPFKTNPLVAIDHDTDLSKIEDNTRLNSLVSHETMIVNEKFKGLYEQRFKAFLFVGTNKPVKITDSKSGIIRRLIDISPTGNKIPKKEYDKLKKGIKYELGAIAAHCLEVYKENPNAYDNYIPLNMMGATNDFFNFMLDNYFVFKDMESVRLNQAWDMYKAYAEDAKVPFPLSKMVFKEELKAYFKSYEEKGKTATYIGFRAEKFEQNIIENNGEITTTDWLVFGENASLLDEALSEAHAQYAGDAETPVKKWENVRKVLAELDTHKLHYVLIPPSHIVIDFDLKDENGNKSLERNIVAASKFPPTYAELSKSGQGIHLHYIYTGDTSKLATLYDEDIEIKVFSGNASLRRKLSKCNMVPIRTISSGLPLKKEDKMISFKGIEDEKHLRAIIAKHLRKEIVPNTKPSMDLLVNVIEEAYKNGLAYDITDMRPAIINFALSSTHQSDYCIKLLDRIHWSSDDNVRMDIQRDDEKPIAFFDCEVFSNVFILCYKVIDIDKVFKLINPTEQEMAEVLSHYRLIGFNCRRYDNHICYARYIGYSTEELYALSQRIISDESTNCFFKDAYNLSYTDVYDYASKKQSLKKWEIELGIFHKECEYPWDKPLDESHWLEVADYCANDVLATQAVFNATQGDWQARLILAEWAGMTPNTTTNTLTAAIIFGDNKIHADQLQWRDMGDTSDANGEVYFREDGSIDEYTVFDKQHRPIFPGYSFNPLLKEGKSSYRGEDPKEGGYVYAEPGIYIWIALLDIASMHPSSAIAEKLFGIYTQNFEMLKTLRIHIKHKEFDKAKALIPEHIAKYLEDETNADNLAQALKIAINAVYGLTSAKFDNPFHDPRNKDNIVAKRGALFMINLKHRVQELGYTVVHIKTDSIKIANADMKIIRFVQEYGRLYGYSFEHEGTYERICLVNDAVYIARYATVEQCAELYGMEYVNESKDCLKDNKKHPGQWTATGTQFAVPYVFKTLFSHEPIVFDDMCEAKSVTTALYLGDASDVSTMRFVGKVGRFTPMLNGKGLYSIRADKEGNAKYDSVVGCKDYKWLESADVKDICEDQIDKSYYFHLVDVAKDAITKAGANTNFDISHFLSDEMYSTKNNYI